MAINNMAWNSGWAYGGDNGTSVSMQVNFAPQMAVAQASLSGAEGGGLCMGVHHTISNPSDTRWSGPGARLWLGLEFRLPARRL